MFSNIGKSLGDGSRFRFWWDNWVDGVVFKEAFPKFFAIFVNKEGKVQELVGFVFCDSLKDSLIWKGSSSGVYSANIFSKAILRFESPILGL
ncbi:hypothetical protein CRYUN_Cryun03dG0130400 [Craigia yunnanensis]